MQTQHTIKKLVLDLTTNARTKPYALQRKCSSLITEKFAPGAEQVFNRHFPDEDIITIRKIEIDLGDLSIDELDKELIHLCLQQLHTQLQQLKLQPSILAAETIQTKSRQQYLIEQFLQFLKTGRVQQSKMFTADWEMQLLVSVKENTTSFLRLLQTVLNNYPAAHERLVSQFHQHFIIELLLTAAPDIPREWFHIINLIKQNLDPPHHHLIRRKIILVMIRILFLADTLESSSFFVQLDIVVKNWNNETNETSKEAIA